eukprot:TRINITY_DN9198_c0_g1_i1.p1 TRINITY_DN9198_c0_g1~~TRINITY_DN9198_c0_g1_i1.p1  ORF type:complete len:120 (+),score=2.03 TRINITY_DN9198_c0_g1_i1:134-493(+)
MQCSRCYENPQLVRNEDDVPDKPEITDTNQRCFACGKFILKADNFYYCKNCKGYFLCSECRLCKAGHFMAKCIHLSNISPGYVNNKFGCDICQKFMTTTDNGVWHCTPCKYDVCPDCLD